MRRAFTNCKETHFQFVKPFQPDKLIGSPWSGWVLVYFKSSVQTCKIFRGWELQPIVAIPSSPTWLSLAYSVSKEVKHRDS